MSQDGRKNDVKDGDEIKVSKPLASIFPTFFVGLGGCGSEIVDKIAGYIGRSENAKAYRDLVHYAAIDTDQDDLQNQLQHVEQKYRFLISDFPKAEYVRLKCEGQAGGGGDPFFKSWWPEWYHPRPDSTKGAGQIRVESRLAVHYQLEDDRLGLIQRMREAISTSLDHDNPYRKSRPATAYCYIYGSLAGGTGSGAFLTTAYLMRELLQERRLSPVIVGVFLLPTLFYKKVKSKLIPDIKANGYAALKELEYLMTLGYNRNPREKMGKTMPGKDQVVFNYNPFNKQTKEQTVVTVPPFNTVYLMDEPSGFSFSNEKQIYPAIAAASYVQLFSEIIGERESEEDNYYKKLKSLDPQDFSLGYGAFGLSMLLVPEGDLLTYCALRARAWLLRQVAGAASEEATSQAEDQLARTWLSDADEPRQAKVREAAKPRLNDFDKVITDLRGKLEKDFDARHRSRKNDAVLARAADLTAVAETLRAFATDLRATASEFSGLAKGKAHAFVKGNLLGDEAQDEVKKLLVATEYLKLKDVKAIGVEEKLKPALDEIIRLTGAEEQGRIAQAAKETIAEKLGRDDDFKAVKTDYNNRLVNVFDVAKAAVVEKALTDLRIELVSQLKVEIKSLAASSGDLRADAEKDERDAEDLRATPGSVKGASNDSNDYVLDAEVLQGTYSRTRHWDRFYEEFVWPKLANRDIQLQEKAKKFARAEQERREKEAAARADATARDEAPARSSEAEERELFKKGLLEHLKNDIAQTTLGRRPGDNKVSIWELLESEAVYELASEELAKDKTLAYLPEAERKDAVSKRRTELEGRLREPAQHAMVEEYVGQKVEFVARKAQILARLRSSQTLAVDPMNFIALSEANAERFRKVVKSKDLFNNVKYVTNWNDERRIAFFTSQLGLPVHNFYPVNGEFREAYERIFGEYVQRRDFPSHVDRQFEDWNQASPDVLLPALEPHKAIRQQDAALEALTRLSLFGAVTLDEATGAPRDGGTFKYRALEGRANFQNAYYHFRKWLVAPRDRVVSREDGGADEQALKALRDWIVAQEKALGAKSREVIEGKVKALRDQAAKREWWVNRAGSEDEFLRRRFELVLADLERLLLRALDEMP